MTPRVAVHNSGGYEPGALPRVPTVSEGRVRSERIITKGRSLTHYYCGQCTYEWDTREPTPQHRPPEKSKQDPDR